MLKVEPNRIHGVTALAALQSENVSVRADTAMIELSLSADHDIDLYFPAPGGAIDAVWLGLAGDVLAHLAEMDNEVQRVSAEACEREGHHPRNYEGELAYITLAGPDLVVLHYFGPGVNTEWDDRFVRTGEGWNLMEDAKPDAAPDYGD